MTLTAKARALGAKACKADERLRKAPHDRLAHRFDHVGFPSPMTINADT